MPRKKKSEVTTETIEANEVTMTGPAIGETINFEAIHEDNQMTAIVSLKSMGIPLRKAVFHRTVVSLIGGSPENAFYDDRNQVKKAQKSRQALMWYTPNGLLVEQVGKHKLIPLANVSDTDVL